MRSLGVLVVLLLPNGHSALANPPAGVRGEFALAAALADVYGLLLRVLETAWLGPGLILAFLLIATLKGVRRAAYKPLQRRVHSPKLERYRGIIPRRHKDLEV